MNLARSLLMALVQVDGDTLVMRNGDKPFVISSTGQVNLEAQGVAVTGTAHDVMSQLLPLHLQHALDHTGVAQYDLPYSPEFGGDHFTLIVARTGDDVSVEILRRRIPDDDRVPEEFFTPRDGAQGSEPYPVYASGASPEMPRGVAPKPATSASAPSGVVRKRLRKTIDSTAATPAELRALQREIGRLLPTRRNPQPEIQKSAAQVALTALTVLRKSLKRQAMSGMKQKTLSRKQVDAIAGDLMRLEEIIGRIADTFGLTREDLSPDSE